MAVSPLYTSINGAYNAAADMASVALQRSQITNGSYGKLMKAYVKKVGNREALNAYRATGSTTVTAASVTSNGTTETETSSLSLPAKKTIPRSEFLDNHLKSIGKPAVSRTTAAGKSFLDKHLNSIDTKKTTGLERAVQYAEQKTGRAINAEGVFVDLADKYKTEEKTTPELKPLSAPDTDQYEKLRSTWLDSHLKSYDKDASARADANINYSVALDISV